MASESEEEQHYHPTDALTPAVKITGVTGTAGLFVAAVQATLTRRNIGALGTFTHYGTTITTFGRFHLYHYLEACILNARQLRLGEATSFSGSLQRI